MTDSTTPEGGTAASRCSRATVVHASITANGVETTYARLGSGPTVVLLQVPSCDLGRDAIARALAARFRVIAPDLPVARAGESHESFAAWMRDLLDGLGCERANLVAAGALGPQALAFARGDPLRVQRVALLGGASGLASPGEAIAHLLGSGDSGRDD